uniref:Uncharacterized protein n=1 Tax=Magallana gigas TaxID=29159 RepID=K1P7Y6_MAGGI
MTDVAGSTVSSTVTSQTTEAMTDSITSIPTVATCATRSDCNQQNTHLTFPTFTMPCPVDHIDCVNNECFCRLTCPVCDDENPNCDVTHACSLGEVCMIRNTPFTVHCSKTKLLTNAKKIRKKIFGNRSLNPGRLGTCPRL